MSQTDAGSSQSLMDLCCFAGSNMAPQTSGNGPDGAHPPITRSPMAQERGGCPNISNYTYDYNTITMQ